MATTIVLDPVTRIEGHLKVSVVLDSNNTVTSAKSTGNLYRDFENILLKRPPIDAAFITQRICGVCPVSHAVASVKAIENAAGFKPSLKAVLMRNLIQGADFIQSNILHFYHLAALDFIKGPQMSPWAPGYNQDIRLNDSQNSTFVTNYVTALTIRRKAHEMGAILAGKLPHVSSVLPGGVTTSPTSSDISTFKTYLNEISSFITGTYKNDANTLASIYNDYYKIGKGYGNLISYGVFDLDASGNKKLFSSGVHTNSSDVTLNTSKIIENVKYSWYTSSSKQNPADGTTTPSPGKSGAYSWMKAPRYSGMPHETGSLARAWVNGDYKKGISVMDRMMARYLETEKIATNMKTWINEIGTGSGGYTEFKSPDSGSGFGLTEAGRGALGHWISISGATTSKYQIVTPTCWNASPKDDSGNFGPIEKALIGTKVANTEQPVELLRIVHSFDPCLACAVHVISPEGEELSKFIIQ